MKGNRARFLFLCVLLFATIWVLPSWGESESLIVFVQPGASAVDKEFQNIMLPKIRRLAQQLNLTLHVIAADKGAPQQVTITPLIVFQNHLGRAIYQGRTTTLSRIESFVRTSRFVAQSSERFPREKVPVWTVGRTRIVAPVKVTPLKGALPGGFDQERFEAKARKAMSRGFSHFRFLDKTQVDRTERTFYMDLYPWLSTDGTLHVSVALFSQFHCKKPVFIPDIPFSGLWTESERIFVQAATAL